jgi:hypothetical protein
VDAMMEAMPLDTFDAYRVAYEDDPWDGWRQDYGPALVSATVMNLFREKGRAAISPRELMPKFGPDRGREKEPQGVEEMKAASLMWMAGMTGRRFG